MSFVSLRYLIFLPVAALVYWLLPKRARPIWLLLASYVYYMCWLPVYALLMAACTLAAYAAARMAGRAGTARYRRLWTAAGIAVCLGLLAVFKYAGFLADTLASLGLAGPRRFSIAVPVGISFYTFQAVGYLVDVGRGRQPERRIVRFALFVSFFPQLVAGPIERADRLLPQLDGGGCFDWARARRGLVRIGWGFFLKLVLADRLAPAVDAVFSAGTAAGGLTVLAAAGLFALQIYGDFAGYCEIAIGTAELLGVTLSENFRQPYFALGMTDHWRRWHITLNDWFRRYVYAPLTTSPRARERYRRLAARRGRKTAARLSGILPAAAVWLLTGLWHGAGWSFVLWGVWHGAFCILEGAGIIPVQRLRGSAAGRLVLRLYLVAVIVPGAILFRAGSAAAALSMLAGLFRPGALSVPGLSAAEWLAAAGALAVLLIVDLVRERTGAPATVESAPAPLRWVAYILLILAVVIFGVYGPGYDPAAFIYFQF